MRFASAALAVPASLTPRRASTSSPATGSGGAQRPLPRNLGTDFAGFNTMVPRVPAPDLALFLAASLLMGPRIAHSRSPKLKPNRAPGLAAQRSSSPAMKPRGSISGLSGNSRQLAPLAGLLAPPWN